MERDEQRKGGHRPSPQEQKRNPGKPSPAKGSKSQTFKNVAGGIKDVATTLGAAYGAATTVGKALKWLGQAFVAANHPEWYLKYRNQMQLVGLNFAKMRNVTLNSTFGSTPTSSPVQVAAMQLALVAPKTATTANDGWDLAINKLWANIRSANNGAVNFNQQELEKYILSARSLVAAVASLRRIAKITQTFTSVDSEVPRVLLTACGVNADDFTANIANLNAIISMRTTQLNTTVPLRMSLIERTNWLFGSVFQDTPVAKASHMLYTVFDKANGYGFPMWKSDGTSTVFHLFSYSDSPNEGSTFEGTMSTLARMFDYFMSDNKFNIIAGDIMRAYGVSGTTVPAYTEAQAGPMEVLDDVYHLTQWQNARMVGAGFGTSFVDPVITAGLSATGQVTFDIETTLEFPDINSFNGNAFLNMYEDKYDLGVVASISRLSCTTEIDNSASKVKVVACGTEVACKAVLYSTLATTVPDAEHRYGTYIIGGYMGAALESDALIAVVQAIAAWTQVDYGPRISFWFQNSKEVNMGISMELWDYSNFAEVPAETFDTLTNFCVMSLLYFDGTLSKNAGATV